MVYIIDIQFGRIDCDVIFIQKKLHVSLFIKKAQYKQFSKICIRSNEEVEAFLPQKLYKKRNQLVSTSLSTSISYCKTKGIS